SRSALANLISGSQSVAAPDLIDDVASITYPMSLRRRGVETRMVMTDGSSPARSPDANLVDLLARSRAYLDDLTSGRCSSLSEVAVTNGTPLSEVSRILPLAFIAPRVVETILAGRQPIELTAQRLSRISELPTSWAEQQKLL